MEQHGVLVLIRWEGEAGEEWQGTGAARGGEGGRTLTPLIPLIPLHLTRPPRITPLPRPIRRRGKWPGGVYHN